jgi:CheY-like chemotaxis protein
MSDDSLRVIRILLVEDNPGDVLLTIEMLKEAKIHNVVDVARDGMEALDFLYKREKFAEAVTPDLILLDLKLPRLDGHGVLAKLKADPLLKLIPVVVLTSSEADEDILKAYGLHANCYVTKPVGLDQFSKIVRSIDDFWLSVVCLPRRTT